MVLFAVVVKAYQHRVKLQTAYFRAACYFRAVYRIFYLRMCIVSATSCSVPHPRRSTPCKVQPTKNYHLFIVINVWLDFVLIYFNY